MTLKLRNVLDRDDIPSLFEGEIAVEVGVWTGAFSEHLLRAGLGLVYSIDPWTAEGQDYFRDQAEAERIYETAVSTLAKFGDRSHIIREFGERAAIKFGDQSIDLVYIDSSHLYEETRAQLGAWWPKVRCGGMLAGHDFCNGEAVRRAVTEFADRHSLSVCQTERDKRFDHFGYRINSWMICKE